MEVVDTSLIGALELILEGRQDAVERMSDEKELFVRRERLVDHRLLRSQVGDGGVHGVPGGEPSVTEREQSCWRAFAYHLFICLPMRLLIHR